MVAMVKREDVGTLREFDDDGVIRAIRAVVLRKLRAKASSLYTNHGVELRIEISGPPKDLGGNLELFNGRAGVLDGMLSQVAEQFAERFRAMKRMASYEPIDLLEELLPLSHRNPLIR
jgi:hypothetical protein